jgi:hypothetical protein
VDTASPPSCFRRPASRIAQHARCARRTGSTVDDPDPRSGRHIARRGDDRVAPRDHRFAGQAHQLGGTSRRRLGRRRLRGRLPDRAMRKRAVARRSGACAAGDRRARGRPRRADGRRSQSPPEARDRGRPGGCFVPALHASVIASRSSSRPSGPPIAGTRWDWAIAGRCARAASTSTHWRAQKV